MAAKTWLDMSNWTQGEVTFAQAIGLGKYVKLPQLTAVLPAQANAASVAAADKAIAAAAAGAGAAAAGGVSGGSTGTGSGAGGGGGTPSSVSGGSQAKPGSTPTPSNSSQNAFWAAVLASIGAPNTAANINSLNAWARHESIWPGGPNKGGLYNPLNTTLPLPGATNYNSVGVKNYLTPTQGVQGTAQTLLLGYPSIVTALKSGRGLCGNPSLAGNFLKWSGNGYSSVC